MYRTFDCFSLPICFIIYVTISSTDKLPPRELQILVLLFYSHIRTNTTGKNTVYSICALQYVSADFYGPHQEAAEFT
jgi:hypothetical protein